MTIEQRKALETIQGNSGFVAIQQIFEEKISKVRDVMGIQKDGYIAEQTLARQLTCEILRELLNDITLVNSGQKEERRTYE